MQGGPKKRSAKHRSKSAEVGSCLIDSFKRAQKIAPLTQLVHAHETSDGSRSLKTEVSCRGHVRRQDEEVKCTDVRYYGHCVLPCGLSDKGSTQLLNYFPARGCAYGSSTAPEL